MLPDAMRQIADVENESQQKLDDAQNQAKAILSRAKDEARALKESSARECTRIEREAAAKVQSLEPAAQQTREAAIREKILHLRTACAPRQEQAAAAVLQALKEVT